MRTFVSKYFRMLILGFAVLIAQFAWNGSSQAQIVALGASNVEGLGVSSAQAFPAQLQAMLRAKGKHYSISNQGISGDTTAGMLARLDSAVPQGTKIVVLFVGGNDIRHGRTRAQLKAGYDEIVARLRARHIRVINAGPYYWAARRKGMIQTDGMHLTVDGHRYVAAQLVHLIN